MFDWITQNEAAIWFMAVFSIISFIASLLLIPVLVTRIPEDYFAETKRHRWEPWAHEHPVIRWSLLILKNTLGYIFIVLRHRHAGVARPGCSDNHDRHHVYQLPRQIPAGALGCDARPGAEYHQQASPPGRPCAIDDLNLWDSHNRQIQCQNFSMPCSNPGPACSNKH